MITEDFLAYLWQYQYFDKSNLQTTKGEKLQIIQTGQRNTDAGADFLNVLLQIGDTQWAGSVELHVTSSEWKAHQHEQNPAYNNVILHVVWQHDHYDAQRQDGTVIPTLALQPITNNDLLTAYQQLYENKPTSIPCAESFRSVERIKKRQMLDRALSIRLERKAQDVLKMHQKNQVDWQETAYQLLAKNMGFSLNAEPFLQLAQALPFKILLKNRYNLLQIEALLLGQAGWLVDAQDEYIIQLQKEYLFLQQQYRLPTPLPLHHWKLLRLRPANFPTMRIAQLAAFVMQFPNPFAAFTNVLTEKNYLKSLQVSASDYWKTHYLPNKSVEKIHSTQLGKSSVENIIINTAAPLLAAYALYTDQSIYMEQAMELLEKVNGEKNSITTIWENLGLPMKTAWDTQAGIEQYKSFCTQKACLQCSVGHAILQLRN
jgi:hypothetical protein